MTTETATEFQLSKGNVKRLLKDASGFRVADDAALQVMAEEEIKIAKVAQAAQVIADEAGRKTILERDIRNAYKIAETME